MRKALSIRVAIEWIDYTGEVVATHVSKSDCETGLFESLIDWVLRT
jgi:hypothetical protein